MPRFDVDFFFLYLGVGKIGSKERSCFPCNNSDGWQLRKDKNPTTIKNRKFKINYTQNILIIENILFKTEKFR